MEKILINDKKWIEFNNKSFYFCHSYLLKFNNANDKKYCKARINSQEEIPSLIIKQNFIGTQFHPEKSQTVGNKFIEKFLNWGTEQLDKNNSIITSIKKKTC